MATVIPLFLKAQNVLTVNETHIMATAITALIYKYYNIRPKIA
jgi:hypothetical protein